MTATRLAAVGIRHCHYHAEIEVHDDERRKRQERQERQ